VTDIAEVNDKKERQERTCRKLDTHARKAS
jgi:hypothetical protein